MCVFIVNLSATDKALERKKNKRKQAFFCFFYISSRNFFVVQYIISKLVILFSKIKLL
jgi:hypothetical protein